MSGIVQRLVAAFALLALTACVQPMGSTGPNGPAEPAASGLVPVAERILPVAEDYCRQIGIAPRCGFRIGIDDRAGLQANAYQTTDDAGRPIVAFTAALLDQTRNPDELAFILGHEAAHHILGHLAKQEQTALTGALLAGVMAKSSGASPEEVRRAQEAGASVAARVYSKEFELQADALGAEIAYFAGYDPIRGAAYFDRLPDPGDRFLATHPANGARKAGVVATVRRLQAGG